MSNSNNREKSAATPASDMIPPLPKVNSLQALTRLRAKRGAEWCTFAFVLNRDMLKSDGTLDELHAVVFPLGSFDDQTKAEEHAKNVISITGHPGVISARYATAVPLTTKFNPAAVTEVALDMKGRLLELESSQYKREREEYERRAKLERDIMKEAEEEVDPNSIEHFKRQCYLAIKNRANFHMHKKEADTAWENYKKREMVVRDHYARHPDHEKNWLPYLKEKLIERGEMNLYSSLEAAYKELRDELLGLIDDDDEESTPELVPADNISCECPGGVCLGLKPNAAALSTASFDDCADGICLAPETKTVVCENGVCGIQKSNNVASPHPVKSESNVDEDDELISADAVLPVPTPVTQSADDPGFIDEGDDDVSTKA